MLSQAAPLGSCPRFPDVLPSSKGPASTSGHLGQPPGSEFSFPAVNSSSCLGEGIPSLLVREAALLLRKRKGYVVEAALFEW